MMNREVGPEIIAQKEGEANKLNNEYRDDLVNALLPMSLDKTLSKQFEYFKYDDQTGTEALIALWQELDEGQVDSDERLKNLLDSLKNESSRFVETARDTYVGNPDEGNDAFIDTDMAETAEEVKAYISQEKKRS